MLAEMSTQHLTGADGLMMEIKRRATAGYEEGVKRVQREGKGADNESGASWVTRGEQRLNRY